MTNYQWRKLNILNLITIGLIGIAFQFLGAKSANLEPLELLLWENAAIFDIPNQADTKIEELTEEYLQNLEAGIQGIVKSELQAIVNLGGILGFLVGMMQTGFILFNS